MTEKRLRVCGVWGGQKTPCVACIEARPSWRERSAGHFNWQEGFPTVLGLGPAQSQCPGRTWALLFVQSPCVHTS